MRRVNRPGHSRGTRVGLIPALVLAALPLLAASAFGAPAAQATQHASYLPLTMVPPDYRIAFERDESIYVMNANGSDQTYLAGGTHPAWSPDGRKIAFNWNGSIYVMNADGSNQTNLSNSPSIDYAPVWSRDGRRIAFERQGDIYVMDADGSNQTFLHGGSDPDLSPDGKWIAFVYGENFYLYGWDIWVRQSYGVTHAGSITKPLRSDDQYSPAWSPDGKWIAFESQGGYYKDIYVAHGDGTNLTRLASGRGTPAWSPDARRLAFQERGDVYAIDVDGSGLTNLTANPADDTNPVWSPDGGRIAFVSAREPDAGIYVMNADGSNQIFLAGGSDPVWSPTIK